MSYSGVAVSTFPKRSRRWIISSATIAPATFTTTIRACSIFFPISRPPWDVRVRRSRLFADTGRSGATSIYVRIPAALRKTASTRKPKPSIFACPERRHRFFAMPRYRFTAAASDTMPNPISFMWMWAAYDAGSEPYRGRKSSASRELLRASTNASNSISVIGVERQPNTPRGETMMPRCSIWWHRSP